MIERPIGFEGIHFCFYDLQLKVQVVATDHSTHFFDVNEIPVKVYRDTDEWQVQELSLFISFPFIHSFFIVYFNIRESLKT